MVDKPTSDDELKRACPSITTWLYRDLAKLDRLPRLPLAVLYETQPGYGHWVGLLETPDGVEHFDSYGLTPDSELKWVPAQYRTQFAATSPHVVRMLLGSGRPVNYNEYRLQSRRGSVATCGRWVALRCRHANLTTDQFARGMRDLAKKVGLTPDALTVVMVPPNPIE
jgi:hypothetical protein